MFWGIHQAKQGISEHETTMLMIFPPTLEKQTTRFGKGLRKLSLGKEKRVTFGFYAKGNTLAR